MAVDTRNKRTSIAGMIQPANPLMPDPSGGFDTVAERLMLLKLYAGTAEADLGITDPRLQGRLRDRRLHGRLIDRRLHGRIRSR